MTLPGSKGAAVAFLRGGGIYVQPSAWEGFGMAVAEAMTCAIPVIVSDADSLPDLTDEQLSKLVVLLRGGQHAAP